MASTYVNNLRLEEITTGEKSGTWGSITDTNLELIGEALGYGTENMGSDANTTITVADGSSDSARSFYLKITSTSLSADRTVTLAPNTVSKVWIIENATTGGKAITIKQGTGATIDIPNGDVKMVATDGAGAGGAVYDLLVDLNIATKLTVKNPATSSSPATVLLQSGDTDVAADDVLGKIQFQAPDEGTGTDALLVAGEIAAISEGDFSSSSNATKLSFKTGASEAATEKMSISSVGNVTMKQTATGDDTPMTLLLQTGETDIAADDKLGIINFQAPDEGTGTDAILVAAGIEAVSEGDFSSSSNATKLSFKTASSEAAAEKMALSSDGNLTVSGSVSTGNPINHKNLLINGGMNLFQRSTSATGISSQGYHTADRWNFGGTNGGGTMRFTMARSTTVPAGQGFAYSTKIDCTTADTDLGTDGLITLNQKIEGQNLQRIKKGTASADSLTLSFWVRSNLSGASNLLTCGLYDSDNTRSVSATVEIDSADTWQKVEITFPADTSGALGNDNNNSLQVDIYMGVGSQFTSGTMGTTWASYSNANLASSNTMNLASSTDNEILFTGFQLEQGTKATDFEFEPFDVVLQKGQRYCYKIDSDLNGNSQFFAASAWDADEGYGILPFPTPMRAVPTLTTNGTFQVSMAGTTTTLTGVTLNQGNPLNSNLKIAASGTPFTAGQTGTVAPVGASTSNYLIFDAEL